jgi:hypothetical protein
LNAKKLDFTGVECATDYLMFQIAKLLRTHKNKAEIKLNEISLNGCANVSIWSMHYLYAAFEQNLNDPKNISSLKVNAKGFL